MQPFEAMKAAREAGLDLVEISPTADPPVCKITDYGKFLYQQNKKAHEQRKHQKSTQLKEVKFRPATAEHDYQVRKNQIIRFLGEGHKVKAMIFHRGREMAHQEVGRAKMDAPAERYRRARAGGIRAAHGSEYSDGAAGAEEGRDGLRWKTRGSGRAGLARSNFIKGTGAELSKAKPKVRKLKTHRGAAKRFKVTKSGKIMRPHSGKRHLLGTKRPKRMRHLKKLGGS